MQIFTKGVRYVVLSAVVTLGFFRDNALWVFLALTALVGLLWLIWKTISGHHRLKSWWKEKMITLKESAAKRRKERAKHFRQTERAEATVNEVDAPQTAVATQKYTELQRAAVRQLNCRITDRIQAVFPEATWEWVSTDPVGVAVSGGEGRIRISRAEAFNFADISVNAAARLKLTLLKAVELDQFSPKSQEAEPETDPTKDEGTDVEAWCDLVGRGPLYALSNRLAEKGFHSLSISEDGSVCAVSGEEKTPQFKLGEMPQRKFWSALARLLSDDDHQVVIEGDDLVLRW